MRVDRLPSKRRGPIAFNLGERDGLAISTSTIFWPPILERMTSWNYMVDFE